MTHHERETDWARQVPDWRYNQGPYRDYGWERGQSSLPEFRDPSVHLTPSEWQEVQEWRQQQERMAARSEWEQGRPVRYGESRYRGGRMPRYRHRGYFGEPYGREYSTQGYYSTQAYGRGYNEQGYLGDWGVQGPYTGYGPQGYQRSDDRIKEDVCERLNQHGYLDASNIKVEVVEGEVILSGTVNDRRSKRMAEDTAESVFGVRDVQNGLHISGMPDGGKGRVDRVGPTGVYPASGPWPPEDAEVQGMASWGQGKRGAEGYYDHGESELRIGRTDED